MIRITILTLAIVSIVSAHAQERGNVLIKNGNVLTITKGTLPETDVLIRDGKIAQVGKNITVATDVRVIDASGLFVMPGIIDAHSHSGIDAINEATNPVTAEVFVGDALNPFQIELYRALAGGVTTIHTMHGSANAIGGQCETIKLRYGVKDPELLRMKDAPRTIKFALGENPTRVHGSGGIVPKTRMGVEFVIRQAFSKAQEYMMEWDEYNKAKTQKGFRGTPPVYNLRLETIADILRGEVIIHCHSYRADELQMMLKVCKDFSIDKIVFQHVNEGFKVAPELAAQGAMASVFSDWWAYKLEVYYSTAYNAAILTKNGVLTSINSDDEELMRHLYHEAAKTQKYGDLTDDEALSLITINPAKQLGIDKRVGSIEPGKDGDIAIFQNHPLSIYTVPMMTIVDGVIRFDAKTDPDDMRLVVDPKQDIEASAYTEHKHDRCMENAILSAEHFFDLNVGE
ncbi:MAG TPA: amidohydrolase [Chryseosolibacter sp.]|nr:amidohydrolase [Chryseosolibacter sp.]